MVEQKKLNKLIDSLNPKIFKKDVELVPIRDGYGEGLLIAGRNNPNVVALCADLLESTRTQKFAEEFPDRFLEVGVAEQNLVTVAAGIAAMDKVPFVTSYATFSPGRNWEQIRTTICYNDRAVKIIGSHAGVSVGPDGSTHQALEDMAIMRALPNMTVIAPCDHLEAKKATLAMVDYPGPVYMRLTREKTAVVTTENTPFKIGRAEILRAGKDVAIIACGPLVYEALIAAEKLAKKNIDAIVVNCHTIKPLDEKTILKVVLHTGAVVTVEEHQITGGLGGAVAELLASRLPTPQEFVGMPDQFGQSGLPDELLEYYHLKSDDIAKAAIRVIERKA